MPELIHVRPTRDMRRDFALWAVAQKPKIRTVSESDFGVPPHLFTHMPERLLVGAQVDGHHYVPAGPEEDAPESASKAPAGAAAIPTASNGTQTSKTPAAPSAAAKTASPDGSAGEAPDEDPGPPYPCPDPSCDREFDSTRGRDTHARFGHKAR